LRRRCFSRTALEPSEYLTTVTCFGTATILSGKPRRLLLHPHKDGPTDNLCGRFVSGFKEPDIFRCRFPPDSSFPSQLPEGDTLRVIVENFFHRTEDFLGWEAGAWHDGARGPPMTIRYGPIPKRRLRPKQFHSSQGPSSEYCHWGLKDIPGHMAYRHAGKS
jgi:hypothetical protein